MANHYVGEMGTQVVLDTEVTLTGAQSCVIKVKKPDGTEEEWSASVTETTKIVHTLEDGDFDQAGLYKMQAYVEFDSDNTFLGETVEMYVYDEYE